MTEIDPEEDRQRDLDSEFGPVKPLAYMRHINCIGDNLCAECAGLFDDENNETKAYGNHT